MFRIFLLICWLTVVTALVNFEENFTEKDVRLLSAALQRKPVAISEEFAPEELECNQMQHSSVARMCNVFSNINTRSIGEFCSQRRLHYLYLQRLILDRALGASWLDNEHKRQLYLSRFFLAQATKVSQKCTTEINREFLEKISLGQPHQLLNETSSTFLQLFTENLAIQLEPDECKYKQRDLDHIKRHDVRSLECLVEKIRRHELKIESRANVARMRKFVKQFELVFSANKSAPDEYLLNFMLRCTSAVQDNKSIIELYRAIPLSNQVFTGIEEGKFFETLKALNLCHLFVERYEKINWSYLDILRAMFKRY